MRLKNIIENSDTPVGKAFDLFIQALILISVIAFSVETIPDLQPATIRLLRYLEIAVVSIFSVEYLLRLFVSENRIKYIFSFWGLIDLFAILPFYLSSGIDLRSIRIIRMLRLFRTFKLFRYNAAINRFKLAFLEIKEELFVFSVATGFLLYLAAVGIYYFENQAQPEKFSSIFDSLWWAVATLTTVGYGDVYPITVGGKVFTFLILMLGLGIVAGPTALLASALTRLMNEASK